MYYTLITYVNGQIKTEVFNNKNDAQITIDIVLRAFPDSVSELYLDDDTGTELIEQY